MMASLHHEILNCLYFLEATLITEVLFERFSVRTAVYRVYNGLNLADDYAEKKYFTFQ